MLGGEHERDICTQQVEHGGLDEPPWAPIVCPEMVECLIYTIAIFQLAIEECVRLEVVGRGEEQGVGRTSNPLSIVSNNCWAGR